MRKSGLGNMQDQGWEKEQRASGGDGKRVAQEKQQTWQGAGSASATDGQPWEQMKGELHGMGEPPVSRSCEEAETGARLTRLRNKQMGSMGANHV